MRKQMVKINRLFWCLILCIAANPAFAGDGFMLATGFMALTNSTKQGGNGSSGSTILTETELTYHSPDYWGAGMYFDYDRQGSNETDTGLGLKLEAHADPFYVEVGYAFFMQRAFTDRSIANQRGSGLLLGMGTRFPIGAGSTYGSGAFMQFSYKYRTQTVKEQDGETLDEPIKQIDAYPLFGVGYDF